MNSNPKTGAGFFVLPTRLMFKLCLLLTTTLLAYFPSPAAAQEFDDLEGPTDITGSIFNDEGKPVAGAHVFVESARPRHGSSSVCPSCYPDCRKTAQTDAMGEFTLPAMDGKLLFRLLVVAKGYEPNVLDKVDPLLSPVSCSIWTRLPPADGQKLIVAKVYDSAGKPMMGALLDLQGAETARMTTWGGHKQYIQDRGVTDESGVMTLMAEPGLRAGFGILSARNHAQQWVKVLPGKDHVFFLREGVSLTGRVVKEGRPVANLRLGFSGTDRSAGEFLSGWEVLTDADGRFEMKNLTPNKSFSLYSTAKSAAKLGVLAIRPFNSGADASVLDLGNMEVQSPLHIRGRVIVEGDEEGVIGRKISLSREQAWDYQETEIGNEGEFEFTGFGPETVEIYVRAPGYRFSKKNPNRVTGRSIAGRVEKSLDDFLVILEETHEADDPNNHDDANWRAREMPLRSAAK